MQRRGIPTVSVALITVLAVSACGGGITTPVPLASSEPPITPPEAVRLSPDDVPENSTVAATCALDGVAAYCAELPEPLPTRDVLQRLLEINGALSASLDEFGTDLTVTLCGPEFGLNWFLGPTVSLEPGSPTLSSLLGTCGRTSSQQPARLSFLARLLDSSGAGFAMACEPDPRGEGAGADGGEAPPPAEPPPAEPPPAEPPPPPTKQEVVREAAEAVVAGGALVQVVVAAVMGTSLPVGIVLVVLAGATGVVAAEETREAIEKAMAWWDQKKDMEGGSAVACGLNAAMADLFAECMTATGRLQELCLELVSQIPECEIPADDQPGDVIDAYANCRSAASEAEEAERVRQEVCLDPAAQPDPDDPDPCTRVHFALTADATREGCEVPSEFTEEPPLPGEPPKPVCTWGAAAIGPIPEDGVIDPPPESFAFSFDNERRWILIPEFGP